MLLSGDFTDHDLLRLPKGAGRCFFIASAAGFLADTLLYHLCAGLGADRFFAHALAFAGNISALLLVSRRLGPANEQHRGGYRVAWLLPALLLIWLLRIGAFAWLEAVSLTAYPAASLNLPALAAALVSAAAGSYIFNSYLLTGESGRADPDSRFGLKLIAVVLISLVLRFLFAGSFELLKEEAYYWAYAQHLDIGYLDHPPMVAVFIKLGTLLLGNSELAVRLGAILCWIVAVYFVYRYAAEMKSRENGLQAAAIMSVVPGFFMFGLFMTPDSPLIACWAATIFFLRRALVDLNHRSWFGVGLFLGLGLFSKYTIALLGPAILTFMIIDRKSRQLLIRPYPYGAALLALLVFSPVILWNIEHDWASFLFQTQNRLEASSEFSTHEMLLFILILLGPVGFGAALAFLFGRRKWIGIDGFSQRNYLFAFTLTAVPLLIFLYFSLSKEVKFNWTAPVWLAALPFMAMTLSRSATVLSAPMQHRFARAWEITILVLFLAYGALFHFFAIGIPGLPYRGGGPLWGWQTYARQVDQLADSIGQQTGRRPLVVGMDQYKTASGLAFYRTISRAQSPGPEAASALEETASRNIAGERSAVMYEYWFSPSPYEGRPMVLVSPSRSDLNELWITRNIDYFSDISQLETERYGRPAAPLYYRLANVSIPDIEAAAPQPPPSKPSPE